MILPIYAYGQSVLKQKAEEIDANYPDLPKLIEDMWETMYNAKGVGLAAPQVGKAIRLFLVDTKQLFEKMEEHKGKGIKQVFINAEILDDKGEPFEYEEGCLSIPEVTGDVERPPQILIRYQDENFEHHERGFGGMSARVIQHEYDHIEGILFTEKLKPLKKRRIKRKLESIKKGEVELKYPMRFNRK